MKILLVDDEDTILRVLGDFLGDCGHCTRAASNGAEALTKIEANSDTDLILSDIRMPTMDGIHLLKAARVRHPGIPVVLMTGHGDESIAIAALREGAHGYLKKPVKLDELLSTVEQLEERKILELQVLAEYKELLANDQEPSMVGASRAVAQILTCVNSAHKDLGSLADLCNALGNWGRDVAKNTEDTIDDATFLLDELPGLLSSIWGELNRIEYLVGRGSHDSR